MIQPGLFEISAMSVAMWGTFPDRKSYIGCRTADHIKFKRTAGRIQKHICVRKKKKEKRKVKSADRQCIEDKNML